MIKRLAIIVLIFGTISATAQINLEYTFPNSTVTFYAANKTYYGCSDASLNQIKIYNSDYSLFKSISITPPTGYTYNGTYIFSDKLFNSDNKIEFLVSFVKSVLDFSSYYSLKLYNEDGLILKDFGTSYMLYPSTIKLLSGETKLSILRYVYDTSTSPATLKYFTDIYSLPGSIPSSVKELSDGNLAPAFPNPSNSIVNLSVPKNIDSVTKMRIFNIEGKLIDEKQVDGLFENVILNVSSYPAGIYIYECNKVSNRFIVN